ncbi:hypothetical protein Ahy_B05g074523 [Arachis hypogaea]|uniref:Aminotransferase-like plant mobile domain-containing protein n=1 Tax=Arachis hypogaea TaxID=3818 RepID=A0A444YZ45_ARAHY|nr:hypothetical protein Ahy_B05g074523 [Arachis hypogaea]
MSGYSSAVKLEIEKFDGRINFGLWQIQVKDVLIQSGLHKALKEKIRSILMPETHTFHLPVGEVTVTLEDVIHILGLQVNGEPVMSRSDSSYQFLVDNCIACFGRQPGPDNHVLSKFLPLLRDFHPISEYSWGAASLAHLYRSLCRASWYNCKEMDGPLILLFVWAWESMPFMAPIPRNELLDVGVPLARRWSHWRRHTRYTQRSTVQFRRGLDDMGVNNFTWRPYVGVDVPQDLGPNLFMCSTKSPLVLFECIEWHPTDRVPRQFGLQQLPPDPAFQIGSAHCRRLSSAQHHDWRDRTKEWLDMWRYGRYNSLEVGDEIVDFHPLPLYYDWYTQQYGGHLQLSDRVAGEQADANAQQEGPPQPAGPQHQDPAYDQGFRVSAHDHHFQMPAFEHPFMMPAYEQHYQVPAYEQHVQEPAYAQQFPVYQKQQPYIPEPQQHQVADPYIPHLVIPADGQFSPLGGLDLISFSRLMRETSHLFPALGQQGPAGSEPSVGRRATSSHASDFDIDRSSGHVDPPRPSAPPRTELFDLNEYPQPEEGFLGHDLQHESHYGGYSAPGMSNSGYVDAGGASMPDVGVGDASISQGHWYNLRTQTAPPDKYTPSQYAKKAPRK